MTRWKRLVTRSQVERVKPINAIANEREVSIHPRCWPIPPKDPFERVINPFSDEDTQADKQQ